MPNVLIIDYGMGNLQSVKRAFEECGARAFTSDDPGDIKTATHLVLPGVGSFNDGMLNLNRSCWPDIVKHEVYNENIPILGICLGMQLLAYKGFEGGEVSGLGLIPGNVIKMKPDALETRIPHMGWNETYPCEPSPIFKEIAPGTDFYFVHSYHFIPDNPAHIVARTPYCGGFISAVMNQNIFGVQFHPEKSQKPGFQVIRNFLSVN